MERKILYADSNQESQSKIQEMMGNYPNLEMETADSVKEAKEKIDSTYKILVTELSFPEEDSSEIFEYIEENDLDLIGIIFSNDSIADVPGKQLMYSAGFVSKSNKNAHKKLINELNDLLKSQSEISYPVPDNEEERLKEVSKYDINKLRDSNTFDRLTEIGSEVFDTRWCFLGIINEEREEFISFHGSDTDQLERSCTICTFSIAQDDVMVVENREKDARFKYVDELEDLGIKWYAGKPVKNENGHKIGAFCVAHDETKEFTNKDRELLTLLAEEAGDKMEMQQKINNKGIINKLKRIIK